MRNSTSTITLKCLAKQKEDHIYITLVPWYDWLQAPFEQEHAELQVVVRAAIFMNITTHRSTKPSDNTHDSVDSSLAQRMRKSY